MKKKKAVMTDRQYRRLKSLNMESVLDKFFKSEPTKVFRKDWMFDKTRKPK